MRDPAGRIDVAVVGSLNVDRVHLLPALPSPGETVIATAVTRFRGGNGLNQAVASARAGAPTHLIDAIGDDANGRRLLERLESDGIEHSDVLTDAAHSTGCAIVAVDVHGTNAIVVDPGANAVLRLHRPAGVTIETAAVVLVSCEIPRTAIVDALRNATGARILNPAPASAIDDDVRAHCNIVTPSSHELADLAATTTPRSAADAIEAAHVLRRRHPSMTVIATLGVAGVVVVTESADHHIAAPVVDAVDSTGAGDCFNGYLAAGLAQGAELRVAASVATRAASISVTRPGSSSSIPRRDELR